MKHLIVDLTKDPQDRWLSVDRRAVQELVQAAERELWTTMPRVAAHALVTTASVLAQRTPEFYEEIGGLADEASVSRAWLAFLNLAYDLSSCGLGAIPGMFGCSAVLARDGFGLPMIARSLDWNFPSNLRKHLTPIRYKTEDDFVDTLGFPGLVGCVTGQSVRGVAISLNQAFHLQSPIRAEPVPWLIRRVLTESDDYLAALRMLTRTPAMSSAFYLIAGTSEGALVESTGTKDLIHELGSVPIFQTNHFSWESADDYETVKGDSFDRQRALEARFCGTTQNHLQRLFSRYPLYNADTVHLAHMSPARRFMLYSTPSTKSPWRSV